ncbi:hypothetical protein L596_013621 [Steinernema carpocapsae]|uniref:Protein kinase domain-containing protein n=1 Tax=Steinernema carpocapsae TaxID=34508 RepID=A0A4U5P1K1_STECR|nr:hypothetical protein L596_013621 [Steinernema carpocapsae]
MCCSGAVDEVTRDQVAVKYVSNLADVDLAKYTLREIRLFLRSNHPNVVKMVNVLSPQVCLGEPNLDIVYIVLEKVQASLTHVINMARVGKHKLTQKHTSFMLYQILCGVKYLHKSGITHMDLKPDCIGVNEKGCAVKLFGFGLGRKRPDNLKMSPYVVTRFYRAPELLLEMDFDNRVDTWSIGCILAEMILKKVLFPGQNYFTQWTAIVSVLGKPKKEFFDKLKPKTREFALQTGPLPGKTVDELVPDNLAQSEDREPINLLNAKSFLDTVLKIDPALRSTVEEALKHPYVNYWYDKTEAEVPGMKDVKEMEIRMLNEEKSLEDYKGLIRRELDTYQRQPSNNVLGKPPPDTIYSGPFPILR